MTDEEGHLIELALHLGFKVTNDGADEYACTEAQLLEFAKRLLGRAEIDAAMLESLSTWFRMRANGFDGPHSFNDMDVALMLRRRRVAKLVDPEQMAKAIAFAGRCQHDVSKDADEFWHHTHEEARERYRTMARAALMHLEGDNHAEG